MLTHTADLGYGFAQPGGGTYIAAGISDGLDDSGLTLRQNLERLATVPLLFVPGSAWSYSLAIDVLGAVLEAALGAPLAAIVAASVTTPLGMAHSGFCAAPSQALVVPYADGKNAAVQMTPAFVLPFGASAIRYAPGWVWQADAFASGGTGLLGNAGDYLRFLETLRLGGAPVLGAAANAAFVTHAVGDLTVGAAGAGLGWGLGVSIVRDPAAGGSPVGPGSWQWGGVYGHSYWVDPAAELSVVTLTNTAGAGMAGAFPDGVKRAVYAGLG